MHNRAVGILAATLLTVGSASPEVRQNRRRTCARHQQPLPGHRRRPLALNCGHRTVEAVHNILDNAFDEDRCRIRTGPDPENTSRLRRFAIGVIRSHTDDCIAAAMRRLHRNPRFVFDYLRMTRKTRGYPALAPSGGRTNWSRLTMFGCWSGPAPCDSFFASVRDRRSRPRGAVLGAGGITSRPRRVSIEARLFARRSRRGIVRVDVPVRAAARFVVRSIRRASSLLSDGVGSSKADGSTRWETYGARKKSVQSG